MILRHVSEGLPLGLLMPRLGSELPKPWPSRGGLTVGGEQDPGMEARYLKGVLPLLAEVKVGRSWAETH